MVQPHKRSLCASKAQHQGAVTSLVSVTEVQVDNAAPQLSGQSSTVSGFVNTVLRNSGTWRDSVSDTVELSASLGQIIQNQDGTWSWSYLSQVPRTDELITITARDSDGASRQFEFRINVSLNTQDVRAQSHILDSALTNVRRATVLVDFKSEVINFTADDVELVNATVVNLIDQGAGTYAIELEAQVAGEVSVKVLAARVIDNLGRTNTASQTLTWRFVDTSNMDFGDAPNSTLSQLPASYPTLLEQDGARHALSPLWLGSTVDAELNGVPSLNAVGDDVNGPAANPDDEDGIEFNLALLRSPTQSTISSFTATASGSGLLSGWIDFNQDGDWDDAGEQVAKNIAVVAGENWIPISIPQGAQVGQTYARFRLSSQADLLPTGAASDGEVEDHVVTIRSTETPVDLSFSNGKIGRAHVRGDQQSVNTNCRHQSLFSGNCLECAARCVFSCGWYDGTVCSCGTRQHFVWQTSLHWHRSVNRLAVGSSGHRPQEFRGTDARHRAYGTDQFEQTDCALVGRIRSAAQFAIPVFHQVGRQRRTGFHRQMEVQRQPVRWRWHGSPFQFRSRRCVDRGRELPHLAKSCAD